jgi:hypothetical protein
LSFHPTQCVAASEDAIDHHRQFPVGSPFPYHISRDVAKYQVAGLAITHPVRTFEEIVSREKHFQFRRWRDNLIERGIQPLNALLLLRLGHQQAGRAAGDQKQSESNFQHGFSNRIQEVSRSLDSNHPQTEP